MSDLFEIFSLFLTRTPLFPMTLLIKSSNFSIVVFFAFTSFFRNSLFPLRSSIWSQKLVVRCLNRFTLASSLLMSSSWAENENRRDLLCVDDGESLIFSMSPSRLGVILPLKRWLSRRESNLDCGESKGRFGRSSNGI